MQKKTEQSTQKVVSQNGRNLSEGAGSRVGLLAGLLVVVCAAVLAVHWPALSAEALSFDDQQYLTENLLVQNPSWASAKQFLTEVLEPSTVRGYYQPLAMISLMVDYALGGRPNNLLPFHRTSLGLHMANTALVIVLLYLLFGRVWVVVGAGLLFGLHPMTVEPIPWVGERKTLLTAFFALWCLILYVRFTRKSDWRLYIACLVTYVLALMSKPTCVPLPGLMLLIDYWPLRRLNRRTVLEKLPFFVVGGALAIITYISQSRTAGTALPSEYGLQRIPLVLCHNIIFYLYKIVWPVNLSSHYAFPEPLGLSDPMVMAGVIGTCILVPLLVISLRRTRVVLVGWLFFFVAILPTMQIIGFSDVIASDKFAYLPSIGLLMVVVSFLSGCCGTGGAIKPTARRVVAVILVLILAGAEAVATRRYLVHWRDTISLYEHMLTLTPDAVPPRYNLGNALQSQDRVDEAISHYRHALKAKPNHACAYYVHYNLGNALTSQGKLDEAISHYRRAVKIKPDYAEAHNNLGVVLRERGKINEAITHHTEALRIKPDYFDAHYNLGIISLKTAKLNEAVTHFSKALQLKPDCPEAHAGLGRIFLQQYKLKDAVAHFTEALRIKPDFAVVHKELADALILQGKFGQSIKHYTEALQFKPDWIEPMNNLAWIKATQEDPEFWNPQEAVQLALHACKLTEYSRPNFLDTLAAAYAALGRFSEAVQTAEKAIALAEAAGQKDLANGIQKRLRLYQAGQPYRRK